MQRWRTEHDDDDGGEQQPHDATGNVGEDNGYGAVDAHVAKQQRAQQQVTLGTYCVRVEHDYKTPPPTTTRTGHDAGCVSAFLLRPCLCDNLERNRVEREQAKGEAAKEGGEGDEACSNENGCPRGKGDVGLHAIVAKQRVTALQAIGCEGCIALQVAFACALDDALHVGQQDGDGGKPMLGSANGS